MSVTLHDDASALPVQPAAMGVLANKLKARLAAREGVAPKPEIDELRRLIQALDPISPDAAQLETLREANAALDPFMAAAHAAASQTPKAEAMTKLRAALYQKALYTPAPTFYAAKALGAVLKAIGL